MSLTCTFSDFIMSVEPNDISKKLSDEIILYHKNSDEAINSIKSASLEGAILFFASQKRLELKVFNELFNVRES